MPRKGEHEPQYVVTANDIQRLCPLYTGEGGKVLPARESETSLTCETPDLGIQLVYAREKEGVALKRREGGIYPLELECAGCAHTSAWSGELRKKVT